MTIVFTWTRQIDGSGGAIGRSAAVAAHGVRPINTRFRSPSGQTADAQSANRTSGIKGAADVRSMATHRSLLNDY